MFRTQKYTVDFTRGIGSVLYDFSWVGKGKCHYKLAAYGSLRFLLLHNPALLHEGLGLHTYRTWYGTHGLHY